MRMGKASPQTAEQEKMGKASPEPERITAQRRAYGDRPHLCVTICGMLPSLCQLGSGANVLQRITPTCNCKLEPVLHVLHASMRLPSCVPHLKPQASSQEYGTCMRALYVCLLYTYTPLRIGDSYRSCTSGCKQAGDIFCEAPFDDSQATGAAKAEAHSGSVLSNVL